MIKESKKKFIMNFLNLKEINLENTELLGNPASVGSELFPILLYP